jgi:hypothetical protein
MCYTCDLQCEPQARDITTTSASILVKTDYLDFDFTRL